MKKGFTLIELAIVLVIIGLLLGMAMKGRALIDAARAKADVNKLQKIATGYTIYFSKNEHRPGGDTANTTGPIVDNLTKEGILNESDFYSSLAGGYWGLVGCETSSDNNTWQISDPATKGINQAPNVCALWIGSTKNAFTYGIDDSNVNSSIPLKFACYIETLLDNKDFKSGDGRANYSAPDDWDCSQASDERIKYLYRIF